MTVMTCKGHMARGRCCAQEAMERGIARARECETAADWAGASAADRRDNSALLDNNSANQRLTKADVDAMRAAGVAGADIIDAMVANSATFADKTQFSQARDIPRPAAVPPVLSSTADACPHMLSDVQRGERWFLRLA